MSDPFSRARELEGQRVRFQFTDGVEMVGLLVSAVEDLDGSRHLIYDEVEWASDPREFMTAQGAALHTEGEYLSNIEAAEPRTQAQSRIVAAGVGSVIALAERIFGNRAKATIWLTSLDDALEERTPMTMLTTELGRLQVESRLWAIDEGMYS